MCIMIISRLISRPDVFSGPLSELEIWQRRQKVLYSVADQLKNKECKTVIGILITAKSRVLKKWKLVDAGLVLRNSYTTYVFLYYGIRA